MPLPTREGGDAEVNTTPAGRGPMIIPDTGGSSTEDERAQHGRGSLPELSFELDEGEAQHADAVPSPPTLNNTVRRPDGTRALLDPNTLVVESVQDDLSTLNHSVASSNSNGRSSGNSNCGGRGGSSSSCRSQSHSHSGRTPSGGRGNARGVNPGQGSGGSRGSRQSHGSVPSHSPLGQPQPVAGPQPNQCIPSLHSQSSISLSFPVTEVCPFVRVLLVPVLTVRVEFYGVLLCIFAVSQEPRDLCSFCFFAFFASPSTGNVIFTFKYTVMKVVYKNDATSLSSFLGFSSHFS